MVTEGVIAAALTSLMILLFLGSWRSTVIIAISIPLAMLGSIVALSAIGETLNIMTLGGLALAVGILVDDATVTIENINWHLEQGKDVETAILDGAQQIVTPAFVSLLCICIVFVPMFFLQRRRALPVRADGRGGDVRDDRVVHPVAHPGADDGEVPAASRMRTACRGGRSTPRHRAIRWCGSSAASRRGSSASATAIAACWRWRSAIGAAFVVGFLGFVAAVVRCWCRSSGATSFPSVDAGEILMHVRAPIGTRIEETARSFADVRRRIRQIIPPDELGTMVDNIGLPVSGINLAYNNTGAIGPQDGDIQITLKEGHRPTADYVQALRERCRALSRARPSRSCRPTSSARS